MDYTPLRPQMDLSIPLLALTRHAQRGQTNPLKRATPSHAQRGQTIPHTAQRGQTIPLTPNIPPLADQTIPPTVQRGQKIPLKGAITLPRECEP